MDCDNLPEAHLTAHENLIERVFKGEIALDGIMSPLTRVLVKQLEASGVDMTLAWACTSIAWECPACGRTKPQIVRLNSKRQLMCRLVEHHDHMKDLVESEFKLACNSQETLDADEQAKRFAARASQMVSAYDNAIVCDDCNGADATAKAVANTHKSFSYSPQEIRKFVRSTPNRPHEIDEDIAHQIWQENTATFELRLKIIKRIATIAATDTHWYQELPDFQRADSVYRRAEFLARSSPSALYDLTGDKRRPVPEDLSQWRRVVQAKPSTYPSNKDVEYVTKVISEKFWSRVPDTWQCDVCKRPKRETIRKSKKDWIFLLSTRGFFDPSRQYNTQRAVTCAECGALATNLGKEASLMAGVNSDQNYAQYLRLSELEQVVKPQAYGRHNVNNDLADRLMETLVVRVLRLKENVVNELSQN
jgi:rubredoxin